MKGEHVVKAGETTQLLTEVTGSYELDMALLSPKVPGLGSDGELAWVEEAEEKKVTYESRRIKVNCKKEAVEVGVMIKFEVIDYTLHFRYQWTEIPWSSPRTMVERSNDQLIRILPTLPN